MKKILSFAFAVLLALSTASCDIIDFAANALNKGVVTGSALQVKSLSDLRVAIDAGHGGIDNGTKGLDSGVLECDLNLAIAKLLADKFSLAGANALMTRETADVDYSGEGATQKLQDMNNRIKFIKNQNAQVLVSIHMNTFSDRSVRGAQVFYQKGSTAGEGFARSIQDALNAGLNDKNKRHNESGEYYLLKGVDCPSVIVECGFLSNSDDEKNLQDPEYQKKLVDCIYKGVCDYLGLK